MAMYVARPRGPSSQEELELRWDHPVLQDRSQLADAQAGTPGSRSVSARFALSADDAFHRIAGKDPRPLLILRECLTCTGTDDALLTRQVDNEKTLLLSRWFHLVKLPANVIETDHPFHALFSGDDPGHLFVARADGTGRRDLRGDQSRTELWKVMESMLKSEYAAPSRKPLKELARLLDKLDETDLRVQALEARLDDAIEKSGPRASKTKKLEKKLEKERSELAELLERSKRASDLPLKEPAEKATETAQASR